MFSTGFGCPGSSGGRRRYPPPRLVRGLCRRLSLRASWAYTIGFDETLDHPELVAFDLPKTSANALFWRSFDAVRKRQLVIEDGLQAPFTDTRCGSRRSQSPEPKGPLRGEPLNDVVAAAGGL
jgi:hypothetical protein